MWGFYNSRNRQLANNIFNLIKSKEISSQFNGNFKSPKHGDQAFLSKHVLSYLTKLFKEFYFYLYRAIRSWSEHIFTFSFKKIFFIVRLKVYPQVQSSAIVHDSYLCSSFGGGPFPTKRLGDCFIGSPAGRIFMV